nr:hypothetical protein [Tanacetum cinerariifolium]
MQVVQIVLWYLDSGCSKHMTWDRSQLMNFVKKFIGTVRFGNDHFGAIKGYGDYVIGNSVISRVYYVEGLGHNLFSVGQFCDSDLEVAFRKHSCYVRDTDGVELIKDSRGSNLYTILVEDMMKSSPKDLVRGLPRLKFEKDHLCSACQLGKSKKHTHKPKTENTNLEVLNTLHTDLCGPMRVQTINGNKYILVIVDDYSRFSWIKILRSTDETPEVVIKFIQQIQVGLNKTVRYVRTDNGTEFVNHTLTEYYKRIGIFHQKTVSRTPQQNDVVERRNRTLVEAARTMLIFSKALMFLVFGALCYPTNDSEDLEKLQPTADIGIFVGPAPNILTPGQISSGLVPNPVPATPYAPPTNKEMEILFQPMFDEYLEPPRPERPVPPAQTVQAPVNSAGTPSSTTIDQDAPFLSISPSSSALKSHSLHQGVAAETNHMEDHPVAPVDNNPFVNVFALEPHSKASSSGDNSSTESTYAVSAMAVSFEYQRPQLMVPLRYQKTRLSASRCQLDEQWFVLTKDTLREALQITPVDNNQAFVTPLSSDALINFVNELGYPKLVRNLSNVVTNDMFQPWRALTTIINMCITGKTSGFKRPRAPVLQILWGFHPRPDSPLHLPNEEPVLGYLKFSAKGTKREVFGMHIPGSLITADIQEASYYQEYLENVAKHRRYLAVKQGVIRALLHRSPLSLPGSPGKRHTLKSVAESMAKDAPAKEPHVAAEDANLKKALEESMKSMHDVPRGPLPPVVIREPESEKYQPLPEVSRKGKAKVTEEQVAHDLLNLQKPKKKSLVDQYIFQRRNSTPTGSSGHDEPSYAELGQSESEEESEKVVPRADKGGQGEGQAGPDPGAQAEGQVGSEPGAQDEGQAGSNPDKHSEGQAGPDPGNAGADAQSMPSPVVHAGSDREHMDLDVADVSPQPSTEQMDEGFTATAYPKVHQQFKATATETTTTTTTTLPPPPNQRQSTAEAMMMKHIGELEHIMANLIQENKGLEERLDKHGARLYTLKQSDIPHQVSKAVSELVTEAVDWAMQAPLRNPFRDLPEADMKEILHQRMWETESYKSHEDHMQLYEALKKSMNRDHSQEIAQDLAEARKKKKKSRESPKMPSGSPPHQPPPPPPPAGPSGASGASGSS